MGRGLRGAGGSVRVRLPIACLALALAGAALLIAAALAGSARPLLAQEPGGTVEMDRAALLALYEATDGPNWTDSSNWGSDAPLADWHGVRTDGHGRVTGLTLERNNLTGTLPAALGHLDALTVLALGGNRLTGPVPAALGALANLAILTLGDNGLTGPLPAALGNLPGLRVARFAGNAVIGCVPHGLRDLLAAPEYAPGVPAQDFLPFDGNGDGDLDDAVDLPGLDLPFCLLRELRLSGAALDPPFAPGRAVYNASVIRSVAEAVVTATTYGAGDAVTIRKGTAVYAGGEALPLDLGPNLITIEVVPPDSTPKQILSVTLTRRLNDDALTVRPGALSPAFSDTVDFYTVHVAPSRGPHHDRGHDGRRRPGRLPGRERDGDHGRRRQRRRPAGGPPGGGRQARPRRDARCGRPAGGHAELHRAADPRGHGGNGSGRAAGALRRHGRRALAEQRQLGQRRTARRLERRHDGRFRPRLQPGAGRKHLKWAAAGRIGPPRPPDGTVSGGQRLARPAAGGAGQPRPPATAESLPQPAGGAHS